MAPSSSEGETQQHKKRYLVVYELILTQIGIRLGQCLCLMGDLSNITSSSPWTIVEEREEEIEEVETEANKTPDENETVGDSEEEDDEGTVCSNEGEKTETIDVSKRKLITAHACTYLCAFILRRNRLL